MIVLLSTAHALLCIVDPIGIPHVNSDLFGATDGTLFVDWPNQNAPFANRFRLRDSNHELVAWTADRLDDTVRFRIDGRLHHESYVLEHLHRYDEDGSYDPNVSNGGTWYPYQIVNPISSEKPRRRDLSWRQTDTSLELEVSTDARRVHFELEGFGDLGPASWRRGEVWTLSRMDGCIKGNRLEGGDRIRAVFYGPGGAKRRSPWTTLHPFFRDTRIVIAGVSESTARRTWVPVASAPLVCWKLDSSMATRRSFRPSPVEVLQQA